MYRDPDQTSTRVHKGHVVTLRVWLEPAEKPYEGDDFPAWGAWEGWDAYVEAELSLPPDPANPAFKPTLFVGQDVFPSIWGETPFVTTTLETQAIPAALEALEAELARVASGEDVEQAQRAQWQARALVLALTEL